MTETCDASRVQFSHASGSLGEEPLTNMWTVDRKLLAMAHRNTGIKLVQKDAALVRNTRIGPAAETLRRMTIDQLRGHMEAFYEHGTLPDLLLLCAAFDCVECKRLDWSPERAWLVDSLLTICDR